MSFASKVLRRHLCLFFYFYSATIHKTCKSKWKKQIGIISHAFSTKLFVHDFQSSFIYPLPSPPLPKLQN